MKKLLSLFISIMLIISVLPLSVSAASDTEIWKTFSYSMDGPEFSLNVTDFLAKSDKYVFYAAAYDTQGNLIDVKTADINTASGRISDIDVKVSFADTPEEDAVNIDSVKTMLWDTKGDIRPVAESGDFDDDIDPRTCNEETDVYNSLTSGFYTQIAPLGLDSSINKRNKCIYATRTSENGDWSWSLNYNYSTAAYHQDMKLTTGDGVHTSTSAGTTTYRKGFYRANLNSAVKVDRVVASVFNQHSRSKNAEFYLFNGSAGPINGGSADQQKMEANYNSYTPATTAEGICYLGKMAEDVVPTAIDSEGAMQIFDVDDEGTYDGIAIKVENPDSSIFVNEIHAYQKKQRTIDLDTRAKEVNVAEDAAAFAYGTAAGNDASMAVDGDASTKWTSINNDSSVADAQKVKDYLILDLGKAYSVSKLVINPAEGVAQNFTVWGANEVAAATSNDVTTTGYTDKTALTDALTGLSANQNNAVTDIKSENKFRYIIFEQAQAESTFGFNEIEVYTLDSSAANHAATGAVELASFGTTNEEYANKIEFSSVAAVEASTAGAHEYNTGRYAAGVMINGIASDSDTNTSSTQGKYPMVMIDLGEPKNITHVAYQYYRKLSSEPDLDGATDFMIVASNSADCYNLKDSDGNDRYTVLVDVTGKIVPYSTGEYNDTGLVVFEVPDSLKSQTFQYVGILKKATNSKSKSILGCSTLQPYVKAAK